MNTIEKTPVQMCTGCKACFNACSCGAITFEENFEGFSYPKINKQMCSNCGLCAKVCPIFKTEEKNSTNPEIYAITAKNEIRKKSSSGGVFGTVAEYIIKNGGYVCGARFKKDWSVEHVVVDNLKDLEKLRGSKYIQSDIKNCYKEIENLLNEEKTVLFSGCPCQVAGLYSYLKKDYEKLYTTDILCHGIPSNSLWQQYLKENFDIKNISDINFRDKEKQGWTCSKCVITFKDGTYILTDDYTKMFHNSISLRSSCYDCEFSKLPRIADISLGDFWGVDEYLPEINDKSGVSLVFLNNKKAQNLFSKIDFSKGKIVNVKLKDNYNNGFIRKGLCENKKRNSFFNSVKKYGYNSACDLVNEDKYDVCLLTTFYSKNYGAMLVAYAVYHIINKLGYSCLMLQKLQTQWKKFPIKNTIPMDFANKHYNISKSYYDEDELIELNEKCKNFVVGSDQMFSYALKLDFAFLGWVKSYKNKIAFCTSFGHDRYLADEEEITEKQYLLDRFNHLSLREVSENLCNKIFKIKPKQFIDPSLMVEVSDYEELAKNVELKINEPYLLSYILDLNNDKIQIIKHIAEKLNLKIINIQNLDYNYALTKELEFIKNYTPEEFLYLYKNASFVVTDSYHGTCFSVKFNKPFVSVINQRRGKIRYKMFDEMEIKNRFISSFEELKKDMITFNVDFTKANKIIKEKTKEATDWLNDALKNNNAREKFSVEEIYNDIKIKNLYSKISVLNRELRKKQKYKKFFSVEDETRENAKHKVVTILGMKFKKKIN